VRAQTQVNRTTNLKELFVRTPHEAQDKTLEVQQALAQLAGQSDANQANINDVGPTWGRQISSKALRGLIVFLILVTIYISVRFEPKMAVGAIAALFHDLLATAGIYALLGIAVTPATVIALLTLLGYSLYDTVVVFDKIKENVGASGSTGRQTYTDVVNSSVNKVLMRSINTSLSTLLPIGALLFVGVFLFHATTLEDLAVALFIGTIVGTYSSIFIASPILAALKEREPRYASVRERLATGDLRPGRPAPRPARDVAAAEYVAQTATMVEARGFIVAAPVAYHMAAGFDPIRKRGKLPWKTEGEGYQLEYGEETIEIHADAIAPGERIAIVDDVLATGGTAAAAARLVERLGGSVVSMAFLIELAFLKGREKLEGYDIVSLLQY